MTYPDFVGARLLVAERRYGAPLRRAILAERAEEDAKADATIAAIKQHQARSS